MISFSFVPSNRYLKDPSKSLSPPGLRNVFISLLGRDFIDSGYEIHFVNTDHFGFLPELVAEVDDGEQDLWREVPISKAEGRMGAVRIQACLGKVVCD
jgi:hypothetical protein